MEEVSETTRAFITERQKIRQANLEPSSLRKAFADRKQTFKSDVKKATTLMKRFKNYSADAESTILTQLEQYNVSMFLQEAAQGIVQSLCPGSKFRLSDVRSLVTVCSALHQRYDTFWPFVEQGIQLHMNEVFDVSAVAKEMEMGYVQVAAVWRAATSAASIAGAIPDVEGVDDVIATRTQLLDVARLRATARTLCEWWLHGLLRSPKTLILVQKRLLALLTPKSHVTVNLLHITNLIVRTIGIEVLGRENAAWVMYEAEAAKANNTPGAIRLASLARRPCPGWDAEAESEDSDHRLVCLGHAAWRTIYNTEENLLLAADEQQANEVCFARIREVCGASYSTEEAVNPSARKDAKDFMSVATDILRASATQYKQMKSAVEGKWRYYWGQVELRGAYSCRKEKEQMDIVLWQMDIIYVQLCNLAGSLGYREPKPLDLSCEKQRASSGNVTLTSASKSYYAVVEGENVNLYDSVSDREFYEMLPEESALVASCVGKLPNKAITPELLRLLPAKQSAATGDEEDDGEGYDEWVMETEMESKFETANTSSGGRSNDQAYLKARREGYWKKLMGSKEVHSSRVAKQGFPIKWETQLLAHLEGLHHCTTPSLADEWAETFLVLPANLSVNEASRSESEEAELKAMFMLIARAMLFLELRFAPSARTEMLPYLSRVLAIIHRQYPDMADILAAKLEGSIKAMLRRMKNQGGGKDVLTDYSSPSFTRRARFGGIFLASLLKFKIIPPIHVIQTFACAIENLQHPQSCTVACVFLENCTTYLLRGTGIAKERMVKQLKHLQEKKSMPGVLYEDALEQINWGFQHVQDTLNPQSQAARKFPIGPVRTPEELYVRYILQTSLSPSHLTGEKLLEAFSKAYYCLKEMPWGCPDVGPKIIHYLRDAEQVGWDATPKLAKMVSLLSADEPSVSLLIITELCEDLRRDLETVKHPQVVAAQTAAAGGKGSRSTAPLSAATYYARPQQHRLHDYFYIAELFRHRVVPTQLVWFLLMQLCWYRPVPVAADDYSRIRCFCTLLDKTVNFFSWCKKTKLVLAQDVAVVWQISRHLLSGFYLLVLECAQPLPKDLQYRVEDLLEKWETNYSTSVQIETDRVGENNAKQVASIHREVALAIGGEEAAKAMGMDGAGWHPLPKTMKEARAYATLVASEKVLSKAAWVCNLEKRLQTECSAAVVADSILGLMGGTTCYLDEDAESNSRPLCGVIFGANKISGNAKDGKDAHPDGTDEADAGADNSSIDMSECGEKEDGDDEDGTSSSDTSSESEEEEEEDEEEEEEEEEEEHDEEDGVTLTHEERLRLAEEELEIDSVVASMRTRVENTGNINANNSAGNKNMGWKGTNKLRSDLNTATYRLRAQRTGASGSQPPAATAEEKPTMKFCLIRRAGAGGGAAAAPTSTLSIPGDSMFALKASSTYAKRDAESAALRQRILRMAHEES